MLLVKNKKQFRCDGIDDGGMKCDGADDDGWGIKKFGDEEGGG